MSSPVVIMSPHMAHSHTQPHASQQQQTVPDKKAVKQKTPVAKSKMSARKKAEKENVEEDRQEHTDSDSNVHATGSHDSHTPVSKKKERQIIALISASRRKGRTPEKKRESAEKASAMFEEVHGRALEIDDHGAITRDSEKV